MMYQNVFLCNSIALLVLLFSCTHSSANESITGSSPIFSSTTKKYSYYYMPSNYGYNNSKKYYNNGYGNGYGYGNGNDYGNGYSNNQYGDTYDGISKDKYGTDMADYGPTNDYGNEMTKYMDVWFYKADDWEQKGKGSYGSKKKGKGYKDSNKNYDNNNYEGGSKKKRSLSRFTFPVKQIKNYRRFPLGRFPPLISALPWVPIFYDKLTYQTYIFSMTGGMYIIPPLINFYGQRFAVAQLIKWGYASLVSTGAPPPPSVDVAPFVQTGAPPAAAATPTFDPKTQRFTGAVKTDLREIKPRYPQVLEEGGSDSYGSYSKQNNVNSNYGGSRGGYVY